MDISALNLFERKFVSKWSISKGCMAQQTKKCHPAGLYPTAERTPFLDKNSIKDSIPQEKGLISCKRKRMQQILLVSHAVSEIGKRTISKCSSKYSRVVLSSVRGNSGFPVQVMRRSFMTAGRKYLWLGRYGLCLQNKLLLVRQGVIILCPHKALSAKQSTMETLRRYYHPKCWCKSLAAMTSYIRDQGL